MLQKPPAAKLWGCETVFSEAF